MGRKQESLEKRFWKYVTQGEPDDCWLWRGGLSSSGRGRISADLYHLTKTPPLYAYQVSWELAFGKIPDGFVVVQTCETPACVNPGHLDFLSREENIARKQRHPWRKGRPVIPQPQKTEVRVYRLNPDGTKGDFLRFD